MSNSAGSENSIIYFIQRILAGQDLYTDPSQPVYTIAQYTPLYYYLIAALAKLFSIHHDQVLELFILNRSASLLLDLCTCFLTTRILLKIFTLSQPKAYTTALIIFIFLLPWSRSDNLSILFWMAGLYFFLKDQLRSKSKYYLLLSILFSFLAVLSKQSGLTLLVIIGLWLITTRQYKKFITFSFITFIVLVVMLLAFILFFDLNIFYKNVVLGVNNGISLGDYFSIFLRYYGGEGLIIFIAFLSVVLMLKRETQILYNFFAFLLISQFVLLNLLALKKGSSVNYLSEWVILVIISTAIFSNKWTQVFSTIYSKMAMAAAGIVVIAKTSFYLLPVLWYSQPSNFKLAREHFNLEKSIASYLQINLKSNEYVITDIPSPNTYLGNLLLNQLLFPQSDVTNTVYQRGVYDFSAFKTQLRNKEIKFLILSKPLKQFQIYNAGFNDLESDTAISNYYIYTVK